jgi:hypothetical protein
LTTNWASTASVRRPYRTLVKKPTLDASWK